VAHTGASFCNNREKDLLNLGLRGTAFAAPAGLFCGLFGANMWVTGVAALGTSAIAVGTFVLPSLANQNGHIYRAQSVTGTHTTGAAEPNWAATVTPGATVTDNAGANQIVWEEATMYLDAAADAAAFPSEFAVAAPQNATSYARISVGLTNFPVAAAIGGTTTGSQSQNGTAIALAAAGSNWIPACGWFLNDSVTLGKHWWYAFFTSYLQVGSGQQAQFNINGMTVIVD
jgi:hypothetical protein